MAQRTAVVASPVGLHARPASLFVKAASEAATRSGGQISIRVGEGEAVDATSLLSVMTLGARHGDTVTLEAKGEGAEEILAELAAVLEQDQD